MRPSPTRILILAYLDTAPDQPHWDEEIAGALGLNQVSVRTIRYELAAAGLVIQEKESPGRRAPGSPGRPRMTCRLTGTGKPVAAAARRMLLDALGCHSC